MGEKGGGRFGKQCVFLWALDNTFIQSALSEVVQPQDGIVFAFQTGPGNGPHVTPKTSNAIAVVLYVLQAINSF